MKEIRRNTFLEFNGSIEYLLSILEDVRYTTLREIKNISQEELHWQYAEGWNSIAALLSHIDALYIYFKIKYLDQRELTPAEEASLNPALYLGEHLSKLDSSQSLEFYLKKLEENKKPLYEALSKLDTHSFMEKKEGYNDHFNLAWLLYHLAEDEVHHRGQIAMLKKLYAAQLKEATSL